jgi:hypothetical protein
MGTLFRKFQTGTPKLVKAWRYSFCVRKRFPCPFADRKRMAASKWPLRLVLKRRPEFRCVNTRCIQGEPQNWTALLWTIILQNWQLQWSAKVMKKPLLINNRHKGCSLTIHSRQTGLPFKRLHFVTPEHAKIVTAVSWNAWTFWRKLLHFLKW